jgi:drug/metabolite transporter (DMT)-like permease
MSAIDEIMELIKHPLRDVKVFTPAQIVFISLVIFVGVIGFVVYKGMPISNDLLTVGVVGAVVTCLFLAVYSAVNKRMGKA